MKKSVSKIVIFNFMHSLCKLSIIILVAMMFCFTGVASALNTPVLEWSWTSSPVDSRFNQRYDDTFCY